MVTILRGNSSLSQNQLYLMTIWCSFKIGLKLTARFSIVPRRFGHVELVGSQICSQSMTIRDFSFMPIRGEIPFVLASAYQNMLYLWRLIHTYLFSIFSRHGPHFKAPCLSILILLHENPLFNERHIAWGFFIISLLKIWMCELTLWNSAVLC